MKLNIRYFQIAGEAIIPLFGFFFWNWSLYFILLFYFFDLITDEVFMHVKSKKISEYQQFDATKKSWLKKGAISLLLLLAILVMSHVFINQLVNNIDFKLEFILFWTYEEMGIEQGYLLVPLLFFAGYQQFKMEFLLPARYQNTQMNNLWQKHTKALVTILISLCMVLALTIWVSFNEIVYVLGIIAGVSFYQLVGDKNRN